MFLLYVKKYVDVYNMQDIKRNERSERDLNRSRGWRRMACAEHSQTGENRGRNGGKGAGEKKIEKIRRGGC